MGAALPMSGLFSGSGSSPPEDGGASVGHGEALLATRLESR